MVGHEGAILAHQQIGVSGNPNLNGFIQIGNGQSHLDRRSVPQQYER